MEAPSAEQSLRKFLQEESQDLVFILPRGVEADEYINLIAEKISEPTLVLSKSELSIKNKYLIEGSLDAELTDLGQAENLYIVATKPYFPAYNFEGVRNIFVLPYPVPERTTNGIANFFDASVWIRIAGGDQLILEKDEFEMSPRQAKNYREVRKKEIADGKSGNSKEKYEASIRLRSLQAGNFIYPEALQKELRKPREKRARLLPDSPDKEASEELEIDISSLGRGRDEEEGGWISENYLREMETENPKFYRVLERLSPKKKTVIYTRFKEHYGSQLLASLARMQGQEIEILSGDVRSIKQREKMVKAFNKAKSGNLILTLLPPDALKNVDQLIFLEGVELELLNKLVALVSGSLDRPLKLIFMIARRSSDLSFFSPFERSISNQIAASNAAVKRCSYQLTAEGKIQKL